MYGDKGVSFTVEAVIAGLMIVSSLLFFFNSQPSPDTYTIGISDSGYNCLKSLDDRNLLREKAMNGNYQGIEEKIGNCLPGLNYTVQLCRDSCTSDSIPGNSTVVVSNYYISGDMEPDPLKIKLSMWFE